MTVDFPAPFSPTKMVAPGGRSRPCVAICATAGTVSGQLVASSTIAARAAPTGAARAEGLNRQIGCRCTASVLLRCFREFLCRAPSSCAVTSLVTGF